MNVRKVLILLFSLSLLIIILIVTLLVLSNQDNNKQVYSKLPENKLSVVNYQETEKIIDEKVAPKLEILNINVCNIKRNNKCIGKLSEYPYPFIEGSILIYGDDVDDNIINYIKDGLKECIDLPTIKHSEVNNYLNYNSHLIVVGNPCNNWVSKEVLDLAECNVGLSKGLSSIEIKKLVNGKNVLLIYGDDIDSIRRASILLKDYKLFRDRLEYYTDKSCDTKISISGASLSVSSVIVDSA